MNFALISQPRSGTHMLATSLGENPDIVMRGEIFNKECHNWGKLSARDVIDYVYSSADGFILHLTQSPEAQDDLAKRDIKFICLYRENYLERYVSIKQAMLHRKWQVYHEAERPRLKKITVDLEDLKTYVDNYNNKWANFRNKILNKPVMVVKYEELISNYRQTLDKIFGFLGVKNYKVKPATIKIGGDPYELIINAEEVRKFVS